jgi:hypothetical protein
MHLIPCFSGTCVLRVPGRQVERLVANFEKFRRLRRRWQNFFSKFRETLGQHPNLGASGMGGAMLVAMSDVTRDAHG